LFQRPENFTIADGNFAEATCSYGDGIKGHNSAVDFFYSYWITLKDQSKNHGPMRQDIHPKDFQQYLHKVAMIDVVKNEDETRYIVRVIGTYAAEYYGELTNKDIMTMSNQQAAQRTHFMCCNIVQKEEPILLHAAGIAHDKTHLSAVGLYLPLFNAIGHVEKILIYVDIYSSRTNLIL